MSSSSHSGNSSSGSSSDSSSSEDEAMAEVKIIDKSKEEQLRVLEEKQAVRKELKNALREHGPERLLKRAKAYVAAQREAQGAKKEAKMAEAE
jgi:hypothetical protein